MRAEDTASRSGNSQAARLPGNGSNLRAGQKATMSVWVNVGLTRKSLTKVSLCLALGTNMTQRESVTCHGKRGE